VVILPPMKAVPEIQDEAAPPPPGEGAAGSMSLRPSSKEGPEVYLGLITPLGVTSDDLIQFLMSEFESYGYTTEELRLSKELEARGERVSGYPERRSEELIRRGDELADRFGPEAVVKIGMQMLHVKRSEHWGNKADKTKHVPRRVWIFRSLKRTEEVVFLRQTYGNAFFALAVHASYDSRLRNLHAQLMVAHPSWEDDYARAEAQRLIEIDQSEEGTDTGQNVRKAFPMADVILPGNSEEELEHDSRRFVRLLFGENDVPTVHEHAMAVAGSTAALSSSLSRKVGAAIVTEDDDIFSVGWNEVPKAGGGQYGSDDHQGRDKDLGLDYSTTSLNSLVANTLKVLSEHGWLAGSRQQMAVDDLDQLTMEAATLLKEENAEVMNLIEFQRSVHAETSALLSAARRGVSTQGSILYTTTYPCHLCAKEIVGAGIQRVFWIEPYPKSRAEVMFGESISDIMTDEDTLRVIFTPFIGVTPRAYTRLFTTEEEYKRKAPTGGILRPASVEALPRVGLLSPSVNVPEREEMALAEIGLTTFRFSARVDETRDNTQGGNHE
jgi:deoxycytidylate deaminase